MLKIMIYDSGNYHNKKLLKGGGEGGCGNMYSAVL